MQGLHGSRASNASTQVQHNSSAYLFSQVESAGPDDYGEHKLYTLRTLQASAQTLSLKC